MHSKSFKLFLLSQQHTVWFTVRVNICLRSGRGSELYVHYSYSYFIKNCISLIQGLLEHFGLPIYV